MVIIKLIKEFFRIINDPFDKLIFTKAGKVSIHSSSEKNIRASRDMVEDWIKNDEVIYGVTTGFGEFKDVKISQKDLKTLQRNLILSHSAGVGKYVPDVIARLMILFRINSLSKGFSGVRIELINTLIKIFNSDIIPLIPSKGSVGSSGDLSPLSHLALLLIGEGSCKLNGNITESRTALRSKKIKP